MQICTRLTCIIWTVHEFIEKAVGLWYIQLYRRQGKTVGKDNINGRQGKAEGLSNINTT